MPELESGATLGRQPDLDFVGAKADGTAFQTTTPLAAGATYTSPWFDSDGWTTIELFIATDQVSGSIQLQFTDNVTSPVVRGAEALSFVAADVARGFTSVRRGTTLDGFRVVYTNGATPQGSFFLEVCLRVYPAGVPLNRLESLIDGSSSAAMGRNALLASDGSSYGLIGRGTAGGIDVGVVEFEAEAPIKALSTFIANQANVTTSPALIITPTANRRSLSIRALTANGQKVYIGQNIAVSTGNGYELAAGAAIDIDLDATASVYAVSNSGTQRVCWMEVIKT